MSLDRTIKTEALFLVMFQPVAKSRGRFVVPISNLCPKWQFYMVYSNLTTTACQMQRGYS
ncbi:hypothetical protein CS543_10170 [Porphyromonas gingivalis]|nr:hypothetical protein CS543_10170 [Porphyromonas gingivalis]